MNQESKTRRRRKSGKIPEFGNWDYSNELPITQYFESARQAGLIHYSTPSSCSSSGECDLYMVSSHPHDHSHFLNNNPSHPIKFQARRRRKESDLTTKRVREPSHKPTIVKNEVPLVQHKNYYDNAHATVITNVVPKPVDEDLYKISPDRLRSSKQKRSAGFFQRCLRPPCMV